MPAPPAVPATTRLASVDAYRGLVMALMMAELLQFGGLAKKYPDNPVLATLGHHQTHVEWVGCSLHDLIQPSFSFLVGVSLPFSLAARRAAGQSALRMTLSAFWRGFLLIVIGTLLRSQGQPQTNYGFIDTLCQIGLGYGFLFLLALRPARDQWLAFAAILVGYWALFALWQLPGPEFDPAAVGVKPEWHQQHGPTGFAAHWDRGTTPGAALDRWFHNSYRRPDGRPFVEHGGGYVTLNFVPTLATMILGLLAGGVLKGGRSGWEKVGAFVAAGLVGLAAGYGLGWAGVCPVVKKIWTPSWVLFSGGWCFVLLAGFYAVVDVAGWRRWAFPLVVVGANSIAAYVLAASFVKPQVLEAVKRHLGDFALPAVAPGWHGWLMEHFPEWETTAHRALTLLILWLVLLWMYRRKIFLKV